MEAPRPEEKAVLWSQAALAFSLFQAELLFVTMAVAFSLSSTPGVQLIGQNAWPTGERNLVLDIWALLAALLTAALGVSFRRWGVARPVRAAKAGLPLLPLSLLPVLFTTEHWFHHPLPFLVILGLFGFLTEACLAQAFTTHRGPLRRTASWIEGMARRAPWLPWATVVSAALAYTAYTGYLTVLNHHRFGTGAFDLGIFNNVMFNSLKGHPFRTSIMLPEGSQSFLLCHSPYLLYAFLPIYALHPAPETMLWIQAALLGSGAIFLFLFAKTQLRPGYAAALSLLYLLFAPMHGAQFYDFHWLTVASPFLFFFFFALARGRPGLIVLSTLLLWALREDTSPGMALLGFILLLSGLRPRAGIFLIVGSTLWFALNKFVIMPSFGTWWFANLYEDLTTPTEKGYGSVIKTLLVNPLYVIPTLLNEAKITYILHLTAPLALIPMRRLRLSVLLLPGALFTVLTHAGANYSIRYQYSSHYAAYLFAGVVVYFATLRRSEVAGPGTSRIRSVSTLLALTACMICHSATYGVVIKPSSFVGGAFPIEFSLTQTEKRNLAALQEIKALIPNDASVTATTKDSPHLSSRLDIHAFSHSQALSEYLVINPSSFGMGQTNRDILVILGSNQYGFVHQARGITLWKLGHHSEETPTQLARLRRRLGGKRHFR